MEKFYKTCITCDARLTSDEKAIYMKLVNRTASEFLCLDCLSKKLGCDRAALEKRIRLPALEDREKENLQGTGNSEKIITLIGEPVTTTSLAALIEKEYHYKTKVLCPLEETDGLIGSQDLKVCGEEEMEEALKDAQIVVADPLYRPICPAECEFYERAHIAFSGRMFLKNK